MLRFTGPATGSGRHEVAIGEATFTLLTRQPTFAEVTEDFGRKTQTWEGDNPAVAEAAVCAARIRAVVVDWEGVAGPDDKPVPFSPDLLESLCAKYPPLFLRVLRIANERFASLPEAEAKNSEPLPNVPPAGDGATAAQATTIQF